MAIKCVWHDHPLQLRSVLTDAESRCFVCLESVSGYNYRCPNCNFFIHISCLKLPLESLHPLHHHPLTLLTNPPRSDSDGDGDGDPKVLCSECRNLCSGFTYHCASCSFSLHLHCALQQRSFRLHLHGHPLTFFPAPFGGYESFRCSVCADLGYGFSLACKACEFVLHVECSAFPVTVESTRHRHPLSLTSIRSIDDGSGEFYCDIVCEGEVNPKACVYYCAECKYMAHLGCMASVPEPHIKFSYQDVDDSSIGAPDESRPETIQMGSHGRTQPKTIETEDDGITKMRRHFSELRILDKAQSNQVGDGSEIRSREEGKVEQLAEQINQIEHFSHQHPLTLGIEHKQNTFSCSACDEKITSNLVYGCTQCNYFLHRWCGELPQKVRHPIHPEHALTLLPRGRIKTSFCNACDEPCDSFTFAFNCDPCSFNLHPMCASIPAILRTEIHRHPLVLCRKNPYSVRCKACGIDCSTGTVFECRECDLALDFKCALLPHRIRHRCHVDPLTLTSVPFEDDSEEFYCDACEELRDATHWVYYCADCEYCAHMNCVVSELLGGRPMPGPLQYDHHEHLLRLITQSPSNNS